MASNGSAQKGLVLWTDKGPKCISHEFRGFHEASITTGKAFSDYNECRPHSFIDYLPPREFRRKFLDDPAFREIFGKKEVETTLDDN